MNELRQPDPATGAAVLRARALCKTYGSGDAAVRAFRDVDLDVARGEFVVLLGASGRGKSTFLRRARHARGDGAPQGGNRQPG